MSKKWLLRIDHIYGHMTDLLDDVMGEYCGGINTITPQTYIREILGYATGYHHYADLPESDLFRELINYGMPSEVARETCMAYITALDKYFIQMTGRRVFYSSYDVSLVFNINSVCISEVVYERRRASPYHDDNGFTVAAEIQWALLYNC